MWSVLNSCGFKVTQYLLDLVLDGTGMVTLPSWGAWAFSCRTCITGERKKKKRKLKTHTVNREITCHRPNDHISLRESERKRENRPRRTKEWSNQTKVKPSKNRKQLHIDEPTDWTNTVKIEVRRKIKPKQRKNEPIKLLDEEVCDHAWLRKRKKSR